MTKIMNFALKIKEGGREVAHAKSFDPATPPKKKLKRALLGCRFLNVLALIHGSILYSKGKMYCCMIFLKRLLGRPPLLGTCSASGP